MSEPICNLADKIKKLAQSDDSGFFKVGSNVYCEHLNELTVEEKRLFEAIRFIQAIKMAQ